jgi:hypothetical protein
MKNNFKKLTRDEQLMVNGGGFGQTLWCRRAGFSICTKLAIPNGQPCKFAGDGTPYEGGQLICSGLLGGASIGYDVTNETNPCFSC